MLTENLIVDKLADLEKEYVDYVIDHFAQWRVWAEASQKVADGIDLGEDEVPEAFRTEMKITKVIVEMTSVGAFDWNNPRVQAIFRELTRAPYYTFFGNMITRISLRLAGLGGVKTLLEIGAGKANLTRIMLQQMHAQSVSLPLVTTDAHQIVLENIHKLRDEFSPVQMDTQVWDITQPPPDELRAKIHNPVLLYERYTLNYAHLDAIRNLARIADIVVFGDWINYTGELFAYDDVFKKIGSNPMFYRDVKPILDECFPHQIIFDKRAMETIKLPTISVLICWK